MMQYNNFTIEFEKAIKIKVSISHVVNKISSLLFINIKSKRQDFKNIVRIFRASNTRS